MSTPQVEAFLEMMAVERDASPHTLSAYGRDLADAEAGIAGGLLLADEAGVEAWYADLGRRAWVAGDRPRRPRSAYHASTPASFANMSPPSIPASASARSRP